MSDLDQGPVQQVGMETDAVEPSTGLAVITVTQTSRKGLRDHLHSYYKQAVAAVRGWAYAEVIKQLKLAIPIVSIIIYIYIYIYIFVIIL